MKIMPEHVADCHLDSFSDAVQSVKLERTRGARWALYVLARSLIEDSEGGADLCSCTGVIREGVRRASPTMVPPHWIPVVVEEACRRGRSPEDALRNLIDYQARSLELLVAKGGPLIHGARRVITLSYSSTVEALIRSVGKTLGEIIVAESRPGGEGAALARVLAGSGYPVRLVADFETGQYIGGESVILLGADAVTRDGCIYNKVGSKLLALAARQAGARVYAVFDATKIAPEARCGEISVDVWEYEVETWGAIRVPVFDMVEPDLLDGYITEAGPLPPEEESVEALRERLVESIL